MTALYAWPSGRKIPDDPCGWAEIQSLIAWREECLPDDVDIVEALDAEGDYAEFIVVSGRTEPVATVGRVAVPHMIAIAAE